MGQRALKIAGIGFLGLVVATTAAVALTVAWLPGFVESRARAALRDAGFTDGDLTLTRFGLEGAELTVRLAEGQGVDRVRLDYTAGGLWAGRVDRVVLDGLRLELQADAGSVRPTAIQMPETTGDAGLPDLPVGELVLTGAQLTLLTPAGPVPLPLDGSLRQPGPGRFQFDLRAGLELGPVAGSLTLGGEYGPDWITAVFGLAPDVPAGTRAEGRLSGGGRLAWDGQGLPTGTADLDVAGARLPDGTPLEVSLRWQGEGDRHDLQALLRPGTGMSAQVTAAALRQAEGEFRVTGMADLLAPRLEEVVRLAGLDLPLSGSGIANLRVTDAPVTGETIPPLDVALRLDRAAWTGMVREAELDIAGRLERREEGWRLTTGREVTVQARPDGAFAAALPADIAGQPLFLLLRPGPEGPLDLTLAMPADGPMTLATAGLFGLEAGQDAAGGRIDGLEIAIGPDGLDSVGLRLAATSLDMPGRAVSLRGLGGAVTYAPAAQQPLRLTASADTVRLAWEPQYVAPFALSLSLSGDPSGELVYQADASAASGSILVEAFGVTHPAKGTGRADIQLYPVRFGPGGRKPAELSPYLARFAEEAEGTVALKARYHWGPKAPPGRAELLLDGVSMAGPHFIVQGLSGVLTADSLSPLKIGQQEVSVGLLDVGLPLTDGLLRFSLPSTDRVRVDQATFTWAGGTVSTQPFTLDLDPPTGSVVLEAQGLQLARVLELAGVDGLAATGTLIGRIPVVLGKDGIRFQDGRLDAVGEGSLRYDPRDPPAFLDPTRNDSTSLVMQALQNFRYSELGLTIDGEAGGEMEVKLRVRGSNPDFYDGYPVALNLNLSGALASILRSGVSSYRIPETVKARIEQFRNTGQ